MHIACARLSQCMLGRRSAPPANLSRNQEVVVTNHSSRPSRPQETHLCRWSPPWWWPACICRSSWSSWTASSWRCACGRPPARRAVGGRGRKRDQEGVGPIGASGSTASKAHLVLWSDTSGCTSGVHPLFCLECFSLAQCLSFSWCDVYIFVIECLFGLLVG